ncbi:MAG: hypothetical protein ACJ79S_13260, partial [Gemmatimonadaceae bacterium]
MHLDVRTPIGALFCVIGAVIGAYGAATLGDPAVHPTGVAIDLVWGGVMLAFGVMMLALAGRAARRARVRAGASRARARARRARPAPRRCSAG